MFIYLTYDISLLIKLSFNTPKFTRALDALSLTRHGAGGCGGGDIESIPPPLPPKMTMSYVVNWAEWHLGLSSLDLVRKKHYKSVAHGSDVH
jgi:hypothetical protein